MLFTIVLFCLFFILGTAQQTHCVNNNNGSDSQNIMCTADGTIITPISPVSAAISLYNETDAFRSLYFAYGAYCKIPVLKNWNCKWCTKISNFQVKAVVNKEFQQAYVGFDIAANQIVVSFRGSHNVEDWLDNLNAFATPYPGVAGGQVHRGFYSAWKDLEPGVMEAVKQLMDKYKGVDVLITGHSLGGALGQLAALAISDYASQIKNNIKIICYTFGSPRWGNKIMANYFNSRVSISWRIINLKDAAPTVPPRCFGYYHPNTQIWYTSNEPLLYTQCESNEDDDCKYIGYSFRHHLRYMGVYESCEQEMLQFDNTVENIFHFGN